MRQSLNSHDGPHCIMGKSNSEFLQDSPNITRLQLVIININKIPSPIPPPRGIVIIMITTAMMIINTIMIRGRWWLARCCAGGYMLGATLCWSCVAGAAAIWTINVAQWLWCVHLFYCEYFILFTDYSEHNHDDTMKESMSQLLREWASEGKSTIRLIRNT